MKRDRQKPGPKLFACIECRRSKLKCDRQTPCRHCVRRSVECKYNSVGGEEEKRERGETSRDLSSAEIEEVIRGKATSSSGDTVYHSRDTTTTTEEEEDEDDYFLLRDRVHHLEGLLSRLTMQYEQKEAELAEYRALPRQQSFQQRPPPPLPPVDRMYIPPSEFDIGGGLTLRLRYPERYIPDNSSSARTSSSKPTYSDAAQVFNERRSGSRESEEQQSQQYQHQPEGSSSSTRSQSSLAPPLTEPAEATLQRGPLLELLWPGWPTTLPDPSVVISLSELFFAKSPLRSLVYMPAYMSGLLLPPGFPDRPHQSLIHAILCVAAPLSSYFEPLHRRNHDSYQQTLPIFGESSHRIKPNTSLHFAEYHLLQARNQVEHAMLTVDRNPLDWVQAGLLVNYALWASSRTLEAFFYCSTLSRAATPVALTRIVSRKDPAFATTMPGLIGPPASFVEENSRRNLFWHLYILDVVCTGPAHLWESTLDDDGITTSLPISMEDFQAGRDVDVNPQTLHSPDLFETGHLDDFSLHVKSCILLKRALKLTSRAFTEPALASKPRDFWTLDRHCISFLSTFPETGDAGDATSIDRVSGWCNLQCAIITLHDKYAFLDQQQQIVTPLDGSTESLSSSPSLSTSRLIEASDRIIKGIHILLSTSYDIALLHPQAYICWISAAKVLAKQKEQRKSIDLDANLDDLDNSLDAIVEALNRAAPKQTKARTLAEFVIQLKAGLLTPAMVSWLQSVFGVIPPKKR